MAAPNSKKPKIKPDPNTLDLTKVDRWGRPLDRHGLLKLRVQKLERKARFRESDIDTLRLELDALKSEVADLRSKK